MKLHLSKIAAFIIGFVYLLSGVSKWIDNASTALKVNEYAAGFHIKVSPIIVDSLSIILVTAEIVIGLCILLNCLRKTALQLAFVTIGVFCIITFLAATSDTMNECGCFGSFLHLTLWQSFTKNILLLIITLLAFFNNSENILSKRKVAVVSLSTLFVIFCMTYCQPLYDTSYIKIGSQLTVLEKGKYKVPLEITLDNKDIKLNQIKDTTIITILREPNSLPSKQFTNILNAITKISKNKKSFIITSPNNSVKALYPNLEVAYTDNNTLENLIQFNIGIIAISEGRLIGKWQQNALRAQKTPQTLAELIP